MIRAALFWLFVVYYSISILLTIIFAVIRCVCRGKCRKMRYDQYSNPCHNKDCKWSRYCEDYRHIFTDEEKVKVRQLIASLT